MREERQRAHFWRQGHAGGINQKNKEDTMKRSVLLTLLLCCFLFQFARAIKQPETRQVSDKDRYLLLLESTRMSDQIGALRYFNQFAPEKLGQEIMDKILAMFRDAIKVRVSFDEYANKPGKLEDKVPAELLYVNSEEFGEYYSLLGNLVGKTRDANILPLLIKYHFNPGLVANFGEIAVEPVIHVLNTESNTIRKVVAILSLKNMLDITKEESFIAQGEIRNKIKAVLIGIAFNESDYPVRISAVEALAKAGDADLIPVLEKIAASDPFHFEEGSRMPTDKELSPGRKAIRYPIREFARSELESLKNINKKSSVNPPIK
jgi:hypothetical protein